MDSKLSYSYIARGQGFKAVKWPESEGKTWGQGWFTLLQVGANFYKQNNLITSLFNVSIDLSFRVQCSSWKVPWSKLYHILWTSRGNGQWREGIYVVSAGNPSTNCTTCISDLYLSTDCTQRLLSGQHPTSNCTDCLLDQDPSVNCADCWRISSNCTKCITGLGILTNDTKCSHGGQNPLTNRTSCIMPGQDMLSNCTECHSNYHPATECLFCVFGWNISTGCSECLPQRNILTNCGTYDNHSVLIGTTCVPG